MKSVYHSAIPCSQHLKWANLPGLSLRKLLGEGLEAFLTAFFWLWLWVTVLDELCSLLRSAKLFSISGSSGNLGYSLTSPNSPPHLPSLFLSILIGKTSPADMGGNRVICQSHAANAYLCVSSKCELCGWELCPSEGSMLWAMKGVAGDGRQPVVGSTMEVSIHLWPWSAGSISPQAGKCKRLCPDPQNSQQGPQIT